MADPVPTEAADPRGLIREAYRIEGITPAECRSIFLDWALGLSDGVTDAARALHAAYAPRFPDHPMTRLLAEAGRPALQATRGRKRRR